MPDPSPDELARLLWERGVAEANRPPVHQTEADVAPLSGMLAMGRAGDNIRKNAPLFLDTAPSRIAQALHRAATLQTPYAGPGLRKEDYTDDPEAKQPIEPMINDAGNVAEIISMGSLPSIAMRGAERSALGIGVPPKLNAPSRFDRQHFIEATMQSPEAVADYARKAGMSDAQVKSEIYLAGDSNKTSEARFQRYLDAKSR